MGHKHLDFRKRCQLYGLLRAGFKQNRIAEAIGVHESTISRELNNNLTLLRTTLGAWQYKPNYAQTYAEDRQKNKKKKIKFTAEVEKIVRDKLLLDWSPEQISGYAKKHDLFSISHERIYQFVLKDKEQGGDLYKHLRHQKKKYRKRYGSNKKRAVIKNRRFIEERPEIVDKKERIGDWEIDTIIGKNHKQAVVSIVERVSKKTILAKVPRKTAELVAEQTIKKLQGFCPKVYTITSDNGIEFSYHEKISKALEADFYFANPYSSWERGLNENTNGLVRQYLKKGSAFDAVDDEKLAQIMDRLNNRPRKSLGFCTPDEVFNRHECPAVLQT